MNTLGIILKDLVMASHTTGQCNGPFASFFLKLSGDFQKTLINSLHRSGIVGPGGIALVTRIAGEASVDRARKQFGMNIEGILLARFGGFLGAAVADQAGFIVRPLGRRTRSPQESSRYDYQYEPGNPWKSHHSAPRLSCSL